MAYESLKTLIRQYIKPNDNEEITGAIMQSVLLAMIDEMGVDGGYLPLTGGALTGTTTVSTDISASVHSALRLAETGVTAESITNAGLSETLSLQPSSIIYQCYYPNESVSQLSVSFGSTGITVSGGITATSITANGLITANMGLYVPSGQTIRIGDAYLSWDATNNAVKVHGADDAAVNFYALGGVSALGYSSSGSGGGGASALSELEDVELTSLTSGQILVYDGTAWVNRDAAASGVTSVGLSMPTAFSVSDSPITSSGTIAVTMASGYSIPTTAQQALWTTAYNWYLSDPLDGYATQTWVNNNYIEATAGAVSNTMLANSKITIAGTPVSLGSSITAATIGNALTTNSPAAYATAAGTATSAASATYATSAGSASSATYATSAGCADEADYATSAGTASSAAYATTAGSLQTAVYLWGNSFDGTSSIGKDGSYKSLSYVDSINMKGAINGVGSIEMNNGASYNSSIGGFIDFHFAGSSADYTSRIIEWTSGVLSIETNTSAALWIGNYYDGSYLQVGGIRIVYDSSNNALKVVKSDGTAANLYATGGLSALGFSGSTTNISVTSCTVSGTLTTYNCQVENDLMVYYNGSYYYLDIVAAINAGIFA